MKTAQRRRRNIADFFGPQLWQDVMIIYTNDLHAHVIPIKYRMLQTETILVALPIYPRYKTRESCKPPLF